MPPNEPCPHCGEVILDWHNEWYEGAQRKAIYSGLGVETLESRQLLTATVLGTSAQATPAFVVTGQVTNPIQPAVTPGVAPIDPAQMQAANGANQIAFIGVAATGSGQTSAITPAATDVTLTVPSLTAFGANSPPSAAWLRGPAPALRRRAAASSRCAGSRCVRWRDLP